MAFIVLRVALAACFLGHGAVAISGHVPWLAFFALAGIPEELARVLLPLIGVHDVIIAGLLLMWPSRALFCWCLCWTLFTAALRSLAGGSVLEVVIRATNWGPPLALLALSTGRPCWTRVAELAPSTRHRRAALLVLAASVVAIAVGIAELGSPLPVEHDPWRWLEHTGLLGVPVALALLVSSAYRGSSQPTRRP